MAVLQVTRYLSESTPLGLNEFEEALRHSLRRYSVRHLVRIGIVSQKHVLEALEKSMQVCSLAGINIDHHFEKIYLFDAATGTTYTDWLMTKKGFNLMIMQYPVLNEQIALWLCELSEL